jgi:hypothetical protein
MPKTATGKIQRRLVAKAMIEGEKRDSTDSVESAQKEAAVEEKVESPKPSVFFLILGRFRQCVGIRSPKRQ